MREGFRNAVVVITGASSGIGRATAHRFAEQGATLVLAARREDELRRVEQECVDRGGRAVVVRTDVTQHDQVDALARTAVEKYGRIDYWVNNAAVTMFARIEEAPREDFERVIQTNLLGYVYGARAAIPYFRERGRGSLINVASVVGVVAQPYTSAYGISKWGIRALGESLRMELMDAPEIHISTVLPATIDTPLFENAANFTGRKVRPMEPVYPATMVADSIVGLARRPRREVTVGGAGRMFAFQHTLAPGTAEGMMARQVEQKHLERTPAPDSHGNLFQPKAAGAAVSGGWMDQVSMRGGTPSKVVLAGLALAAVPLTVWAARRSSAALGARRADRLPA